MGQGRNQQSGSLFQQLEDKIDFNQLVAIVVANKWLIALCAAVCLLLGIVHVSMKSPTYSADLLLQIEKKDSGNSLDKIASLSGQSGASPEDIQTVLIKSPFVLGPVISQLSLDLSIQPNYFPFIGAWYASHHNRKLSPPFLGLSHYAWGGEQLKISKLIVPPAFVNKPLTVVATGNQQYQLQNEDGQVMLRGTIGKEVQSIVPKLGLFMVDVATLTANTGTRFFVKKGDTKGIADGLAQQLQIQDLGDLDQIGSRTGIIQISLVGGNPDLIVSILNSIAQVAVQKNAETKSIEATKTLAFLKQELINIKSKLNQSMLALSAYQGKTGSFDLNDTAKGLMAQIADAQKTLYKIQLQKTLALQQYTPIHPFILGLDEKERLAQKQLDSLKLEEKKLPIKVQAGAMLLNDVKIKGQLYSMVLNKIQATQVMQAGTMSDIQVLEYAKPPIGPLPLHRLVTLFSSMIIGAGLAIFFVIFKSLIYSKIVDPSEIESQFDLMNMAIVPYSDDQAKIIEAYNSKTELLPLVAKVNPRSLSVEAMRSFRTSLKIAMMGTTKNIITITGVAPGVGKSFVSANMAYLLADSGKKILLIDGDLRKGYLKSYFKLGDYLGLSDVLTGTSTAHQAIIPKIFPNLDFMATGHYPESPSELLVRPQFKSMLESLSSSYDLIIIDTPPILAVTDAAILAEHAAANFMVIGAGVHQVKEVDLALKRFAASNVKMHGFIFNITSAQKGLYRQQTQTYSYQYEYTPRKEDVNVV